ncbi:hypothetical protein TNCV_10801 [Trichonephila clavipes]|nr:hypothetical protein TNCV_10801 [Trichonephila clavipes]
MRGVIIQSDFQTLFSNLMETEYASKLPLNKDKEQKGKKAREKENKRTNAYSFYICEKLNRDNFGGWSKCPPAAFLMELSGKRSLHMYGKIESNH